MHNNVYYLFIDKVKHKVKAAYGNIAMLTRSVAPTGYLLSTLVSIPKKKKCGNNCDSANYRQIAINFFFILL